MKSILNNPKKLKLYQMGYEDQQEDLNKKEFEDPEDQKAYNLGWGAAYEDDLFIGERVDRSLKQYRNDQNTKET